MDERKKVAVARAVVRLICGRGWTLGESRRRTTGLLAHFLAGHLLERFPREAVALASPRFRPQRLPEPPPWPAPASAPPTPPLHCHPDGTDAAVRAQLTAEARMFRRLPPHRHRPATTAALQRHRRHGRAGHPRRRRRRRRQVHPLCAAAGRHRLRAARSAFAPCCIPIGVQSCEPFRPPPPGIGGGGAGTARRIRTAPPTLDAPHSAG